MSDTKPARRERNYVVRPDGKPINVPPNRGQLFVCENGCCCGHTQRGFAPVPHDLYYSEWERRKLRNKVHLNHAGCLGPCALANVALLLFDGRPIWFHSVNSDQLILTIYDYIEAMLAADRYLPPPPALANHIFNGFAWDGPHPTEESPPATPEAAVILALQASQIFFLTHADTDLLTLHRAALDLPANFPGVRGFNLSTLPTLAHVDEFIRTQLPAAQVVVLRSLGGRQGFGHGFDKVVQAAHRLGKDLICVPGSEGLDPELTAHSNVPVPAIHDVYRYLHYGGVDNMGQMLRFLADHLLAGAWGYAQPAEQPRHGVYRFGLEGWKTGRLAGVHEKQIQSEIENLKSKIVNRKPTIGILFYRSHWLSGNTDFIDALIAAIAAAGGQAIPVFTTSLKETREWANGESTNINLTSTPQPPGPPAPAAFQYFYDANGVLLVDVVISTISFAMGGVNPDGATAAGWNVSALESLGVPVLQAIASSMTEAEWQLSQRGLRPLDVAMNVALPEFDGRIITVPISFKGVKKEEDCSTCGSTCNCTPANGHHPFRNPETASRYIPIPDRVQAVVNLAMRYATLRRKPNGDKRIVFMLTNSPGKTDRIGNAVGLDTPASLMRLFERMQTAGYQLDNIPESGDALLHELIDRCSYDLERLSDSQLARAAGRVLVSLYDDWFNELTENQQARMQKQWGAPPGEAYVHFLPSPLRQGAGGEVKENHLALAGLELGNIFVALQPPRGYNMDPDAIYHTPDLAPTHNYYALYKWLATPQSQGGWGADAIVHLGKHGTLEWLPGKGIGLSLECFPDTFLADLPLIYPFIINNPGEGAQAKRRAHAVVVDHMIPPMTSADVYGELALLTQLVDEYYQVEQMDPAKLPLVQQQIWELMQKANLDKDINEMMRFVNHGDHSHEWDGSYTDDGTPLTLAEMSATDFSHLLEDIDGYLCELGSLQIRDGLHTLGFIPEGEQLCSLLRALTRIPNGDIPSLRAEVAAAIGFDLAELLENRGKKLADEAQRLDEDGSWRLAAGGWRFENDPAHHTCYTHADVLDLVDSLSLRLLQHLEATNFDLAVINTATTSTLGNPQLLIHNSQSSIQNVLTFICTILVPLIRRNDEEISNLLAALAGQYVPAGPAGAPTRGMAHILPTGRNFYAVDPQAIPSQAAWRVGQQLAEALIARYQAEEQGYPESVGLSIWGTSAMRTHGDDVAQCLALLGVRPVWQPESRRVMDVAVIPLTELGRPRIDVLMRISGFFRDAFPQLIELMDKAVQLVANLDEPTEQNFVRQHYLRDLAAQIAQTSQTSKVLETFEVSTNAERRATLRIFGSKPGSYGAGILPLIHEQNWQNESDLAQAYINWGGYAYGQQIYGDDAREEFKVTLSGVQIAVKNQDNREHDIFDSDDYLQYHGGMIATIRSLNGRNPKSYFGDNSNPERTEVRTLQQEAHRVFRSRVVNPKWIESIQRHGYKGALELAATVDYLFGYDATAQVVEDWMYEQTAQSYALDPVLQKFFEQSNPWALQSISERLLEAAQRGMWANPNPETISRLKEVYLQMDETLEGREG
jgi:cobaltochelatase CobN